MLRHSAWTRRVALSVAVVVAALLVPASASAAVRAEGPLRLDGPITDKVGALAGRTNEVQTAIDRLRADTGLKLFVVYVKSFSGTPAHEWTVETGRRSDLGDRDALLAVATGDRAYSYATGDVFPLTDAQLDQVAAEAIEPALGQNDWAGAAIGAADGYRALVAGAPVPKPAIQPGDPDPSAGGVGSFAGVLVALVCLAFVAAIAIGVFLWYRSRRKPKPPATVDPNDPYPAVATQQLSDRANTLLVELDDALRTSERELGLATAEYGAEATASFTAALESARTEVGEAFRIRMELDDLPKEDEAGLRHRLADIVHRCEAADGTLNAESDAFDELRELETKLDQSMPALGKRRTTLQGRLAPAEAELTELRAHFTDQALAAIAGNPDQARERLRFAEGALGKANQSLSAGKRPPAALAGRAAEQALDQTDELLAAISKVGTDLIAAKEAVRTLLVEVDSDLAAGRSASTSPDSAPASSATASAALSAAMTATEQAAAAARTALSASTMDPLTELRRLQEADASLDRALGELRDAAQRVTRARAMLDQAILAAKAEISAASGFVNTRRGAVGERARTLLAEAQRHLSQAIALTADDPVTALAEAQQADQIAEQATQAARSDVDQWSNYGPGMPGGFAGGRSGVDGLAGAILGGILLGGATRGRRGGFGGGGFGGGGFGGGGFGGGFGGGGFGGGFGGRRGGGGGFGGHSPGGFGGRRGGGGRF